MGRTVLIVDDEAFVRTEIKERIDWNGYGYSTLMEADNGEKALHLCRTAFPDLILTDIRMPVMNGIVLCSELKKIDLNAKIVVLSSYTDFEYVREALKIGVLDYLPKHEMDNRSISAIMEKIQFEEERGHQTKRIDALGKSVYLRHYLTGLSDIAPETFDRKAYSFKNTHSEFLLVQMQMEPERGFPSVREGRNQTAALSEYGLNIGSLLDDCLKEYPAEYTDLYDNKMWIIVQLPHHASQHCIQSLASEVLHSLHCRLKSSGLPFCCSLFYQVHTGAIKDLPRFYQAFEQSDDKKIRRRNEISLIGARREMPRSVNPDLAGIKSLQQGMLMQDIAQVKEALDTIWLKEAPAFSEAELDRLYCDVLDIFRESFMCKNIPELRTDLMHVTLGDFITFEGINEWFQAMAQRLMDPRYALIRSIDNDKLRSVMIYIHHHLHEDLGLKRIADLLGVNKTYLSEMFKEKLGINYSKYILHIRLEFAKQLLMQTEQPIKEIGKAVGYDDTAYFMKTFSKFTGSSPTIYRKRCWSY